MGTLGNAKRRTNWVKMTLGIDKIKTSLELLFSEAKDHKKQERYHRRKAKNLMQQIEVLRHEFKLEITIIGKNEKEL